MDLKSFRTFGEWLDAAIASTEERLDRGLVVAPTAVAILHGELVTLRSVREAANNYGVETTRPFGRA